MKPTSQAATIEEQWIVFQLAQSFYAVDVDRVVQVIETPAIREMPKYPDFVPGLIELNNATYAVIDLSKKYDLLSNKNPFEYTMILSGGDYKVGVLLQDLPKHHIVGRSGIRPIEEKIKDSALDDTFLEAWAKVEDNVVFKVDMDALIASERKTQNSQK